MLQSERFGSRISLRFTMIFFVKLRTAYKPLNWLFKKKKKYAENKDDGLIFVRNEFYSNFKQFIQEKAMKINFSIRYF